MRQKVFLLTLVFLLLTGCAKKNEPPIIFIDNNAPQFTNPATFELKIVGYTVTEESKRDIAQMLSDKLKPLLEKINTADTSSQDKKKYVVIVKIRNYYEASAGSRASGTAKEWGKIALSLATGMTFNDNNNDREEMAYLLTDTYICDVKNIGSGEYIGRRIAYIPYKSSAKANLFGFDYLEDAVSSTAGRINYAIKTTLVNKEGK